MIEQTTLIGYLDDIAGHLVGPGSLLFHGGSREPDPLHVLETVEGRVSRDNKRKDDIQIINFIHKIRFFVISELYVKVLFLKNTYKLFFVIFKNYFLKGVCHEIFDLQFFS